MPKCERLSNKDKCNILNYKQKMTRSVHEFVINTIHLDQII